MAKKMKKTGGGFSYLEVIIAMAVFSVLLMAVLPLVAQARRNMTYAREGYAAHLAAQNIMHSVRDADGVVPVSMYAETYSVWIFDENGTEEIFFASPCAPPSSAFLDADTTFLDGTRTIIVAVWHTSGNNHIVGRAIGFSGAPSAQ